MFSTSAYQNLIAKLLIKSKNYINTFEVKKKIIKKKIYIHSSLSCLCTHTHMVRQGNFVTIISVIILFH